MAALTLGNTAVNSRSSKIGFIDSPGTTFKSGARGVCVDGTSLPVSVLRKPSNALGFEGFVFE
jgi:transglutaminase-like putative cysteine protease